MQKSSNQRYEAIQSSVSSEPINSCENYDVDCNEPIKSWNSDDVIIVDESSNYRTDDVQSNDKLEKRPIKKFLPSSLDENEILGENDYEKEPFVFVDPVSSYSDPNPTGTFSFSPIAERGRSFAARQTQRLVYKEGNCNISSGNVTKRNRKYLVDIFTTCVDMKWRYILVMFTAAFLLSWFFFALVWYIILLRHSDHHHFGDPEWRPCVANVYDFITALLFSIETQHTIGYGYRVMEPTCPDAVILVMVQSCLGVFIQSLMTGLIFAKLSQPKKRAHTIMFSRCAVVTKRDGDYCLLFRVGDMRRSHFVGTCIRALLVKDKLTKEGECIPLCQFPLDVKTETCNGDDFVFMVWPVVVVHKIDDSSPLWDLSADRLLKDNFEIIVILEGIVESTGMTTQIRTSYLPSEILWGHCLAPLLTYQKENGQYKIDYAQFHTVLPMNSMPECSAKEFAIRGCESNTEIIPSVYHTIPPKSNTVRLSMIKRMRGSIRMRKSSKREKCSETGCSMKETGNGTTGSLTPSGEAIGNTI